MTNNSQTINNTMNNNSINQQEKQEHKKYHEYNNNNNYNNIHTVPGVSKDRCWTDYETDLILSAYRDNISDNMTSAVANMIYNAFCHGMSVPDIILAIEETGFAPNPTPWYLKKVLENWAEYGITTSSAKHEVHRNTSLPWWKRRS